MHANWVLSVALTLATPFLSLCDAAPVGPKTGLELTERVISYLNKIQGNNVDLGTSELRGAQSLAASRQQSTAPSDSTSPIAPNQARCGDVRLITVGGTTFQVLSGIDLTINGEPADGELDDSGGAMVEVPQTPLSPGKAAAMAFAKAAAELRVEEGARMRSRRGIQPASNSMQCYTI
ncbi:hypothetical protein B0H63DRAFT_543781 [Podospora didyma]|uniref:Uncharacterized protein n=1 Tax=Podospora didyma TaxID=330526 RepID=A0AAE0TZK1_9PEZI|nr:hypothetical protein B0H63DRAFT_543781 [Podospora didyma]